MCDFSTTTPTHKVISTSLIMNSFKKYFTYTRGIGGIICGIGSVYMAGVRDDWTKMVTMLENLRQYDVDGQLKYYIGCVK